MENTEKEKSVGCEHCGGRIPETEDGVEEHCPRCLISIFAAPEDLDDNQREFLAILKQLEKVTQF